MCVAELQEAGLLDQAKATPTPQPPRKKVRNTYFQSAPVPQTPITHAPKRRIAHVPKHPPQTTSNPNKHLQWHRDTPVPKKKKKIMMANTPGPYSAVTPQFEGKKNKRNRNKKWKQNVMNEEQDFPRSFQNSHCNGALIYTPQDNAKKRPRVLFGSEKSKKKKKKEEKRARKAARDPENLFLIKQRKRSR